MAQSKAKLRSFESTTSYLKVGQCSRTVAVLLELNAHIAAYSLAVENSSSVLDSFSKSRVKSKINQSYPELIVGATSVADATRY